MSWSITRVKYTNPVAVVLELDAVNVAEVEAETPTKPIRINITPETLLDRDP